MPHEEYMNFAPDMNYLQYSPRMDHQQAHNQQYLPGFNGNNKINRSVRKIDGPVIPTEYSDPDLQRQSSEFSAILQQATANVSGKRHDSTFVMDISPSVVGWIIGRSGIRIKEIQSLTGCKMWVDQDVPNDQPRKIYFHGTKQSIDDAVGRVNELVQAAPILSSNHVVSGKGLTSVIVDCPMSLVGLLIGKRGWTIKKIQQASNAQISINQSVREGLPRKIIVSGDEKSVSLALKLITEVLRDKTVLGGHSGGLEHDMSQLNLRMSGGNGHQFRDSGYHMPMSMSKRDPLHAQPGFDYTQYTKGAGSGSARVASYNPNLMGNTIPAEFSGRELSDPNINPSLHSYNQYQGHVGGSNSYPQEQAINHDYGHQLRSGQSNQPYYPANNGQYGTYQPGGSNRSLPGQYSQNRQQHGVLPSHRNIDYSNPGYPPTEENHPSVTYPQQVPSQHQDVKNFPQRDDSPTTVESTGASFNSSIFDFQHRQSPSMGQVQSAPDMETTMEQEIKNIEKDSVSM